jgi:hypothetical protein
VGLSIVGRTAFRLRATRFGGLVAASRARRSMTRFRPRFPPAVRQVHGLIVREVEDRTCVHLVSDVSRVSSSPRRDLRTNAADGCAPPASFGSLRRTSPGADCVPRNGRSGPPPRWDATFVRWGLNPACQGVRAEIFSRVGGSMIYVRTISIRDRKSWRVSSDWRQGGLGQTD